MQTVYKLSATEEYSEEKQQASVLVHRGWLQIKHLSPPTPLDHSFRIDA
jgi:hypothetical protein